MIEQVSDDETNPPIYVCSYNVYQSKISYMTSELIALLFNRALSSENRDFYHLRFSQKQPPLKLNVALWRTYLLVSCKLDFCERDRSNNRGKNKNYPLKIWFKV